MAKRKTQDEYVAQVNEVNPNFDIISEYLNGKCKMNYRCKKCGFIDLARADALLKPRLCRNCEGNGFIIYGVNDFYTLNPNFAKYMEDQERAHKIAPNSHNDEWFICPDCGSRFENSPANVSRYGLSCPSCSSGRSYPNRFMFNILRNVRIDFKNEFSDYWTEGYLYDFMFECKNKKYIIEMDGAFHFMDNQMSGMSAKDSILRDKHKDNLAKDNGYNIIRIDCNYINVNERYQYIKNSILNSELSRLIDFSVVDFNYCDAISQKSDFIRICEIYDSGIHNIDDICKIVGLSYEAIIAHLKHSEEIGCSTYNHIEATRERNELRKKKLAKTNGNLLYCIETNEIFYSIASAKRCHGGALDKYLKGKIDYAGTLDDGTKLHYMRITEEYANFLVNNNNAYYFQVDFDRDQSIKETRKFRRVVMCNQTGEYFINQKVANQKYHANLASYFCHDNKTSGYLDDGTRLTWSKPTIDEVLTYINNGGTVIYLA